jgi:hypothetical protein
MARKCVVVQYVKMDFGVDPQHFFSLTNLLRTLECLSLWIRSKANGNYRTYIDPFLAELLFLNVEGSTSMMKPCFFHQELRK